MADINLTSSMRCNLLSLQTTAKLQSLIQNRLATGLKVSSAVDNPSSFYTAQSLHNRVNDLSSLLDGMGQAVQTIKAANEALQQASNFLQQAAGIASEAIDGLVRKEEVSYSWLVSHGAQNIATDKASLLDKINNGNVGDTIIVYGDIDMGSETLNLKNGMKLVGAQYFLEQKGYDKEFMASSPKLSFNKTGTVNSIVMGDNSLVSNLSITAEITDATGGGILYSKFIGTIQDVDIKVRSTTNNPGLSGANFAGAIKNDEASTLTLGGNINLDVTGQRVCGLVQKSWGTSGKISTLAGSNLIIKTSGQEAYGLTYGVYDFYGNLSIDSQGNMASGTNDAKLIQFFANVKINSPQIHSNAIKRGSVFVASTAKLFLSAQSASAINSVNITHQAGAIIATERGSGYKVVESTGGAYNGTISDITTISDVKASNYSIEQFEKDWKAAQQEESDYYIPEHYAKTYNGILIQYDMMIEDSSYKGLNLLQSQNLQVNFNEDRSSKVLIKGVDASSKGLGLNGANWKEMADITASLAEIEKSLNQIRSYATNFGSYYSITSTREEFTGNLINVLTEGAEKLTLADINEESANMLALQTRQQLATNSLSLASQAAQGVLKLF